ncbi:MAG TPA: hypothetical protein VGZ73_18925 [Bryobacteraceae bacterium]|nr:hypothetical protein [Bryobacteraceae bacterium]
MSQPRSIIVDTGPLLTYLALRYLDREAATEARRNQVFYELRHASPFADGYEIRMLDDYLQE